MNVLRLDSDRVSWVLDDIDVAAVGEKFARSREPLAVPVSSPLRGRLLLSPNAGAVAFLADSRQPGWIPSYLQASVPQLHIPSATGSTGDDALVYHLPAGTDLDELERQVLDAMRHGGRVPVAVSDAYLSGTLVLDGAGLRAVVLCPAT